MVQRSRRLEARAAAGLVVGAILLSGPISAGPPATATPQALAAGQPDPTYISRIMVRDLKRTSSTLVHQGDGIWEAPNWSRHGSDLLVNTQGRLFRIAADGTSAPEALGVDPTLRANNDHDVSRDGRLLAISATSPSSRQSQVYVANADGSNHRHVVAAAPSSFHGWSLRVQLRMIDVPGDTPRDVVPQVVVELTGGPGTINGNSWSPDSTKFGYVTFEAVAP